MRDATFTGPFFAINFRFKQARPIVLLMLQETNELSNQLRGEQLYFDEGFDNMMFASLL